MDKKLRVAQISDLHITGVDQEAMNVDVRENFIRVLSSIKQVGVDYLILTGDLCLWEGSTQVYQWIKEQLDETNLPYYIVPGNHDNTHQLASQFGYLDLLTDGELYYYMQLKDYHFIFMDSSKGYISETQLNWLDFQLKKLDDDRAIIFTHHPPMLAEVSYMDNNFPLKNYQELLKVLQDSKKKIDFFCGHYHVEKTIIEHNLHVFICPSTYFQMDHQSQEFQIDHQHIGWRKINILEGKTITNIQLVK